MSDQISGKTQLAVDDKAEQSSILITLLRNTHNDGKEINCPRLIIHLNLILFCNGPIWQLYLILYRKITLLTLRLVLNF